MSRFERRAGHLDSDIDVPPAAAVDDGACVARTRAHRKSRDLFDGLLCRGEPDPLQAPPAQVIEPLEGQREMREMKPGPFLCLVLTGKT